MVTIPVKNNQSLKRKPRVVSHVLDCGGKREMCEKHKPELLLIPQGQTWLEDHPVSNSEREDPGEAKTSPLGISAYQTKSGEE